MSATRDRMEECETEGTGYITSDGYVHEVISKSPARIGIDGGVKQTITKRVSVTKGEVVAQTAPRIAYATVSPKLLDMVSPPQTASSSLVGGGNNSSAAMSSAAASGPPSRSMSTGAESATSSSRHSFSGVASAPSAFVTAAPPMAMSSRPLSPTFVRQNAVWQQQGSLSPAPAAPQGVEGSSGGRADQGRSFPQQPNLVAKGVDPMEWARTGRRVEPTYDSGLRRDSSASRSSAKSVSYGGVDLREVEPSRLSPLHVHDVYAPIRYVSKRELRAMRERAEAASAASLSDRIRHSSVPRLDALAEQRLHSGRCFSPGGSAASAGEGYQQQRSNSSGRSSSRGQQQIERDEYMFRNQAPVYASNPPNWPSSPPEGRQRLGDYPQPVQHVDPPEYPPSMGGASVDDDLRSVSSAGHYHNTSASPRPVAQRYYQRQVTTVSDLPSTVDLTVFSQHLAFARGIDRLPAPPQFCREAFLLLHRGTYLIKYGRTGNPHERYLALRFVRDDRTKRMYPYLVWAIHQEAVSFKERIPMVHLVSAQAGVSGCQGFLRHMIDPTSISGPIVSGKRSVLPTTYAFSWTFQSMSQTRTVECLALDPETFRCWVLVGQYLAGVNSGAELVEEAETLAPDTPRSTSASAA
jgi:hypothetical protein